MGVCHSGGEESEEGRWLCAGIKHELDGESGFERIASSVEDSFEEARQTQLFGFWHRHTE